MRQTADGKRQAASGKINRVVIAIGVNDAKYGPLPADYFEIWEKMLRQTIVQAKAFTTESVGITTIIPVEKGKALGDQYFDQEKINNINKIIRDVSKETKVQLIDHSPSFSNLTKSGIEYTTDGVHLNGIGYQLMKDNIRKATELIGQGSN